MSTVSALVKGNKMGFFTAVRHFFGQKPGQTLGQLRTEFQDLTPEDKAYFRKHLIADGYVIEDSVVAPVVEEQRLAA